MNDIRIIGSIALAVMIIICAIGMEWEVKAQNFLIAIIVAAIFNFLIGAVVGPNEPIQEAQGFVGFSSKFAYSYLISIINDYLFFIVSFNIQIQFYYFIS